MNNINNQFPLTGYSRANSSPTDYRSAAYVKEQSLFAQEQLNTDLVIETKEGDKVTISSDSFAQLDSYTYDTQGMVQTADGTAAYKESYQEISLMSGYSFSFSVEGDINDEELADIENMLKGMDEIITHVKSGDMDQAFNSALNLGDFDTFNAYAVDISYQETYAVSSSEAAALTESSSTPIEEVPTTEKNHEGKDTFKGSTTGYDQLFDRILHQMEKLEEKTAKAVQNPLNKLFDHHLKQLDDSKNDMGLGDFIQETRDEINKFFETMGAEPVQETDQ